ncbi:ABC-type Fe3+-hydroxamate transport system substrate-binding protein [Gillisia mitskevichiae]|uniref:ABC-type Fe3+-hydroxamate transport system substrate-binding protein n=1 Tax=Gillisia mitskevichiae TaxID=270921 RepID=A0A495P321_9FLAO|nr:helical backbone metal receptor [Gillisia mitskevichiae]RKS45061.1 ABC-type Fe3+-hydroxamate transport system substrate-binding protein [Gillisia mitskevichiae]
MLVKDQLDREVDISKSFCRIVSLVPSLTELVVYLGLEEMLVGITKFCVHPKYLKKTKTIVGGTKQVHLDKIRALKPDLILCNKEENTLEMVQELEEICQVHISNIVSFSDSLELISSYGILFQKEMRSKQLISDLTQKTASFQKELSAEKLKVAYFIWRKPWMVVGGDTFINSMLEFNGWNNIFKGATGRYPEIDLKVLQNKNPDLILLSSEPFPFQQKHISEIRAFSNARIEIVDGEFFSWYGSRQLLALDYFKEIQAHLSKPL